MLRSDEVLTRWPNCNSALAKPVAPKIYHYFYIDVPSNLDNSAQKKPRDRFSRLSLRVRVGLLVDIELVPVGE